MEKVLAIIQARMGSSRLPGKVLLPLENKSVLEHVVERTKKSKHIHQVVVATTVAEGDDPVYELMREKKIPIFRGSECDVLDRYYQCALAFGADHVVRITADCPLIDPEVIDRVVEAHLQHGNDYTSNVLTPTFPDGEDVEIMKMEVLKEAWEKASLASQREHVTQYIIHEERYCKENIVHEENLGSLRWTLDTADDFLLIRRIYEALYVGDPCFNMKQVLSLLEEKPDLLQLNGGQQRNEGLLKSLKCDFIMK